MTLDDVVAAIDLRFQSGNAVPVERAPIKAAEWALIRETLCDPIPYRPTEAGRAMLKGGE